MRLKMLQNPQRKRRATSPATNGYENQEVIIALATPNRKSAAELLLLAGAETAASLSSGGFSNRYGTPAWQQAAVQAYLANPKKPDGALYNASGRVRRPPAGAGQERLSMRTLLVLE